MMTTITTSPRCHIALELSRSRWLVGALLPGRAKVALHAVPGGDAQGLLALLHRIEARASAEVGTRVPAIVCFEAGYDGFWLARLLRQHGVETHVLDAASFLVSRRGRRAKTDRLDVEAMALVLRAYLGGDPTPGGGSRRPIMTAYRQAALDCALALRTGPGRPRDLSRQVPGAPKILLRNVYGWFERTGRGIYCLTALGREAAARAVEQADTTTPA